MIPTFLLDSVMILLLIFAVAFCWRLNHRLTSLKSMGLNLTPALQGFNRLVEKLGEILHQVKVQTLSTKQVLEKDLPQAQSVKEDLEILLEYCEAASKRLEGLIEKAKLSETELDEVFVRVQSAVPKNFKQTLDKSEIRVDFDELKNVKVQQVDIIPQEILPRSKCKGIYIDSKLQDAFGDLR